MLPVNQREPSRLDLDLVSFVPFIWEFSLIDILYYGVHLGRGDLVHLTYPGSDYRRIRLIIDGHEQWFCYRKRSGYGG